MTVALVVATPPVAGIGLLDFTVIFSWLAIPQEALATVMIVDIAVALFVSAVNLVMLMTFLIFEADRQGILDKERLQSQN